VAERIACGRDAYRDEEIAPLFAGAPTDCRLPRARQRFLPQAPGSHRP
jgi:hypothetical protein